MHQEEAISSEQWRDVMMRAQNYCQSIDKRGGEPADAVKAYGLFGLEQLPTEWDMAERIIALAMCSTHVRPN